MMLLLAETTSDGWRPGIGDPTFMGWFTVFAYAAAALLCWRAQRAASVKADSEHQRAARLWMLLAGLFVLLAVNKQLDLQSWFTAMGREVADRGGWYPQRRTVQFIAVAILAAAGVAAIAWLLWLTRNGWRQYGLAVAGATFIVFFVIIRAASFHHVDEILGSRLLGMRMNWIFELGGIACVAVSAALNGPRNSRTQTRPASASAETDSVIVDGTVVDRDARKPISNAQQRESFRWMVERMRHR